MQRRSLKEVFAQHRPINTVSQPTILTFKIYCFSIFTNSSLAISTGTVIFSGTKIYYLFMKNDTNKFFNVKTK